MIPADPTQTAPGDDACALCGRTGVRLTKHHLVPRCRTRKNLKKAAQRAEARARKHETAKVCGDCHRTLHATFTERELETAYSTIEALRGHPKVKKFIDWVQKQPSDRRVSVRWTNDRKGNGPNRRRR